MTAPTLSNPDPQDQGIGDRGNEAALKTATTDLGSRERHEIRLAAAAKHGDHASFEALVELYMGRAIGVAIGYVGTRDEALDMAHDAFYRAYRHLDRFREGERFAPWFFKILRNTCLAHLQSRRRRRAVSIHPQDDDTPGIDIVDRQPAPDEDAELAETRAETWRALAQLSLPHREILLLRHFQDLDYQAIAEVLQIPIGTVMSRLYHARQKMHEKMKPYMEARA